MLSEITIMRKGVIYIIFQNRFLFIFMPDSIFYFANYQKKNTDLMSEVYCLENLK